MVGLVGAGPATTVATHRDEHAVAKVNWALKSGSDCRAAALVPAFCDA
jgi:hypothetical protein